MLEYKVAKVIHKLHLNVSRVVQYFLLFSGICIHLSNICIQIQVPLPTTSGGCIVLRVVCVLKQLNIKIDKLFNQGSECIQIYMVEFMHATNVASTGIYIGYNYPHGKYVEVVKIKL